MNSTKVKALTPRQHSYIKAYTSPGSGTFGNSYQSARAAGYSDQTARNFTHNRMGKMSEIVGQMTDTAISPDEIMSTLTAIIHDETQPTIIRLKSIELTMKAYNMLARPPESAPATVALNIDLSS
jgi:phage terminase small subunit